MVIINQIDSVIDSMLQILDGMVQGNLNANQYFAILLAAFCIDLGFDIVIAMFSKPKAVYEPDI